MLSDVELEQYSRQLMLPDFSIAQQETLRAARVLIVGCGGLGSPLAIYLAAAGVGELRLADNDRVERSNLHRQPLHGEGSLGLGKAHSAQTFIAAQYPACTTVAIDGYLSGGQLESQVREVDLVADGSDNYPTRFALNRACAVSSTALVTAAAVRSEGQLASFHSAPGGPCYRCLYPVEGAHSALSCRESGVLGPVVGVLGTLQALEVIKILTGWGDTLQGRILSLDLRHYEQQILRLPRRRDCPDCSPPIAAGST